LSRTGHLVTDIDQAVKGGMSRAIFNKNSQLRRTRGRDAFFAYMTGCRSITKPRPVDDPGAYLVFHHFRETKNGN
jgi:hypothetical protein